MLVWFLLLLIAGFGVLLRPDLSRSAGLDPTDIAMLAGGLGLIVLIGLLMGRPSRSPWTRALRQVIGVGALTLAVGTSWSHRDELAQLARKFATDPSGTDVIENQQTGERSVRIRRRTNGHFVAKVQVNGAPILMMVDTGATSVVLRHTDAKQSGIDVGRLKFTVPVRTANGPAYAAPVRLKGLAVGSVRFEQIEALVAQPGTLDQSLLGMSFLSRLRSYEFTGDLLTLRG